MAKRIQRRRSRGWLMPPEAVYVGRGSEWGNPFVVGRDGTRAECVELYKALAHGLICVSTKASVGEQQLVMLAMANHLSNLRGRDLACWCPIDGKPCHADVLLELANA